MYTFPDEHPEHRITFKKGKSAGDYFSWSGVMEEEALGSGCCSR